MRDGTGMSSKKGVARMRSNGGLFASCWVAMGGVGGCSDSYTLAEVSEAEHEPTMIGEGVTMMTMGS